MSKVNQKAEQRLVEIISRSKGVFNTGLWIRPINAREEQEKFINAQLRGKKYNPVFVYPKVRHNLATINKALRQIEIDTRDQWGKILARTRRYLVDKIKLLKARERDNFSQMSIKVYGKPKHPILMNAHQALKPFIGVPPGHQKPYTVRQAASILKTVLNQLGFNNWQVKFNHQLALAEVALHSRVLWLNQHPTVKYTRHIILLLIAHEIKTHIQRFENGIKISQLTGHPLLAMGTGGFILLEEGLAYYTEQQMRMRPTKTNTYALRLIAIHAALKLSFQGTYDYLISLNKQHKLQLEPLEMANLVSRVKRGFADTKKPGAYTKDLVYFTGYHHIIKYLSTKNDPRDLYLGKITLEDVPVVKKMVELAQGRSQ